MGCLLWLMYTKHFFRVLLTDIRVLCGACAVLRSLVLCIFTHIVEFVFVIKMPKHDIHANAKTEVDKTYK